MHDILKWGLILGGGYLLYEYFFGSPTASPMAVTGQVTSVPAATVANQTIDLNSISIDNKLAATLTHAAQQQSGRSTATISAWNWLWVNILKQSNNIITSVTPFGDSEITATQYLQARTSVGLSGLGSIYNVNGHMPYGVITTGDLLYNNNGGRVRRPVAAMHIGPNIRVN